MRKMENELMHAILTSGPIQSTAAPLLLKWRRVMLEEVPDIAEDEQKG